MRQVILDGRDGAQLDGRLREKLAGHLRARLAEYAEEGIAALQDGPGTVRACFPGLTGEQAARALDEQGVYAIADGEAVRFLMGPDTRFEDLDYVQAAAAGLL